MHKFQQAGIDLRVDQGGQLLVGDDEGYLSQELNPQKLDQRIGGRQGGQVGSRLKVI